MAALASSSTEALHSDAAGLDLRSDAEILSQLLRAQQEALSAMASALPEIAAASELLTESIRKNGCIHYVAAGSSALMGLADGAEIPGTFGIAADRIKIHMAGGVPIDGDMPGHTEDNDVAALAAAGTVQPNDVVIAISASGSTPYPLRFAQAARERGAAIISIANNASAPLFALADVAIHLNTPPELIAGSTRLGAATSQKVALNMISTLTGIRLGHVFDGMMVNVVADNDKLRARALGIVTCITGVSDNVAQSCLQQANGAVKPAVLLAAGAASPQQADKLIEQTNGDLRAAMRRL
ncbi:N-acetylmuramic acid 6-phosphate etherase [Sedimentitalea sp. CY04]|uniref:N-acetylmuramic acid 6-phosphate etherase n=1 Tax=Parasedimentitalea denitrificans TaxID=2211118 RepID=A0ABX0WA37_9RHOB|nr:N-acetylmuramic acid 6-phosphate etherase [Sedimentitalea sp. CY04]NIZ62402.1 N-acetylmuramic acid 6-phosphate etherase [Sedimentitalea sp. CY04]